MKPNVYRWSDLPQDHPIDLIDRRRIMADRMMVAEVFLHKGFTVPTHQHDNEQISIALSGRTLFITSEGTPDEERHVIEDGQVIVLPSNLPHRAEALEDSLLLDLFSPASQQTGVDRVGKA
jgi:quercetin dioxygenase-like cupin family protein